MTHVVFDASPRRCREARAGLVQILGNDEMVVVPVLYWTSQTASPYLGTTLVYTSELPPHNHTTTHTTINLSISLVLYLRM
jgi:hypothetical protein